MDLRELDPYIVVTLAGKSIADHDETALRIMDGEIEPGIKALWDDNEDTVVAFLFARSYTEDQARAWVREHEEQGINLEALQANSPSYFQSLVTLLREHVPESIFTAASTLAKAIPTSKPLVNSLVNSLTTTIDDRWFVQGTKGFSLALEASPWQWNATKQNVILNAGGWAMYARAHLIVDLDQAKEGQKWPEVKEAYRLPIAELIDDELYYVWKATSLANEALHGARASLKVPQTVKVTASKTVAAIYRKFAKDDEDVILESFDDIRRRVEATICKLYDYKDADDHPHWAYVVDLGPETVIFELDGLWWSVTYTINEEDEVLLGEPVPTERAWIEKESEKVIELTIYSFPIRGALATEADQDIVGDDSDLVWKEICQVAQRFKVDTGRMIEVTMQFLQDVANAFTAKVLPHVSVPADDHHYESSGLVPAKDNTGFVEQLKLVGQSLWAGFRFTDPETKEKVDQGTIKDVSIYAAPDIYDPRTGEQWPWVLMHVLLTNYPQLEGLAPFGEEPVAASLSGAKVIHLQEVKDMTEVTLTAEEAQQFQALQTLGLTDEQVAEWQALGLSFAQIKATLAEAEGTRTKARDLEVQAVLLALQGQGEHDDVVQISNTRHFPVICEAMEKALKEQPQALALSAMEGGKTALDAVILSIINAIPEEGRMSLTVQPIANREDQEPEKEATDDQIDELHGRLK